MRNLFIVLTVFILIVPSKNAYAQVAGSTCATAGQYHESGNEALVCESGIWKPIISFENGGRIGFQVGNDVAGCNSGKIGRMRFISATTTWEFCDGSNWTDFTTNNNQECNIIGKGIGYACPNGSVFAGFAPYSDGSYIPIFTTRCDAGRFWNGSTCTGTRLALPWNNGNSGGLVITAATNALDGQLNTNILVATDSDSGVGGSQPHQAAAYCDNLALHGKSDWYLPSPGEISQLVAATSLIGDFSGSPVYYWTSYEYGWGNPAGVTVISDVILEGGTSKDTLHELRCIRR